MASSKTVNYLRQVRKNTLNTIEGLSTEQLNTIPTGFNNNIIWNVAHMLVTQQLLVNKLSGVDIEASPEEVMAYKKGSKPQGVVSEEEINNIKRRLLSSVDAFEENLAQNKYQNYQEYTTSFGVTLSSCEDAMEFNNVHEGLHFGSILALKKLV